MVESTILCSNNRAVRFVTTLFVTLVLATTFLAAGPRPTLSVKGLANAADLVIVGRVQRIQQIGTGEIRVYGVDYPRLDYAANINVDETIKGEPLPRSFVLTFSTSIADTWDDLAPPQGGLLADTYRVIFLKKTASGYKFVSPYSSSVPASPKPCGPSWRARLRDEDAYHKVLQRTRTRHGSHFLRASLTGRRFTAIPNRRAYADEKEILLMWCTTIWRTIG